MRPIPRSLLIHTATLAESAPGAWQTETLTEVARLRYIRMEVKAAQTRDENETRNRPSALLYYDARHSQPTGVAFAPGQFVLFEGARYRVDTVETLMDGRRAHHVELELSD